MHSYWIVDGDTTDHGGTVRVRDARTMIDGLNVASVGDEVDCPKCKVTARIIEGNERTTLFGRTVAEVGGLTSCGARLISIHQSRVSFEDDADNAPEGAPVAAPTADVSGEDICEACLDEASGHRKGILGRG